MLPVPLDSTANSKPYSASDYTGFSGRARRKEYWWFFLVSLIIVVALITIGDLARLPMIRIGPFRPRIPNLIYALAVLSPTIAVGFRRLHDTGRSGWWWLLSLVPVIGQIVLLVLYAADGDAGDNKYGPDPKAVTRP
jgi:uncharacterized membrane protein YhaH (DUF805 family)